MMCCAICSCLFSGGKSSVLMDIKPWDDETDMKKLEEAVRGVHMEGLLWGACMFLYPCYQQFIGMKSLLNVGMNLHCLFGHCDHMNKNLNLLIG